METPSCGVWLTPLTREGGGMPTASRMVGVCLFVERGWIRLSKGGEERDDGVHQGRRRDGHGLQNGGSLCFGKGWVGWVEQRKEEKR